MDNKTLSVCIRCGKQRIFLSTKEEMIGTSVVVTTETICPDPECQKKVSRMLDDERERRVQSELLKQERMVGRRNLKLSSS